MEEFDTENYSSSGSDIEEITAPKYQSLTTRQNSKYDMSIANGMTDINVRIEML